MLRQKDVSLPDLFKELALLRIAKEDRISIPNKIIMGVVSPSGIRIYTPNSSKPR